MTAVERFAASPAVLAAGWTLLHSLWQGAAVAAALAAGLALLRRRSPQDRYAAACVAMLLLAAGPAITFGLLYSPSADPSSRLVRLDTVDLVYLRAAMARSGSWQAALEGWLPAIVGIWAAGVTLFAGRALGGWLLVHRLCQRAAPVGRDLALRASEIALAVGLRRPFDLRLSYGVSVPSVVGTFRAVVLFPAAALAGLPAAQLEAILAHELAHIRRHDYLVNLIQTGLESLLFYHPAVWWISGQIRAEREHCCDDAAVSLTGDLRTYANALVTLEELRASRLAVAANGGALLPRIRRILGEPSMYTPQHRAAAWLGGVFALTLAAAPFAFARPQGDRAPKPAVAPTPVIAARPSAAPRFAAPALAQEPVRPEAVPPASSSDPFSDRARAVVAGDAAQDEIAALRARIQELERENERLRGSLRTGRDVRPTVELRAPRAEDLARFKEERARAEAELRAAHSDLFARHADALRALQADEAKRSADLFKDQSLFREHQRMAEEQARIADAQAKRVHDLLLEQGSRAERGARRSPDMPGNREIIDEIRALREENRAMQRQMEELRRQIDSMRGRRSSADPATEKPVSALSARRAALENQLDQFNLVYSPSNPKVVLLRQEMDLVNRQLVQLLTPTAAPAQVTTQLAPTPANPNQPVPTTVERR